MSEVIHRMPIRVRYCETDAMGVLHHSQYINYFEMGRTELFREQGGSYRRMEELGLFLVVADIRVKYRRPARYDDLLTMETTLVACGPVKLIHKYRVLRDETVIAEGESILACVDKTGTPQRIPEDLTQLTAR